MNTNSSCVLYLGAIPYNWDVDVIKSVVCGSGPVVDVRCMMDNASKNKGFCFVEYDTPNSAQRALEILGKVKIEGRKKLRIELSKEGLRNPTPGMKPILPLSRIFLPSNVILPAEMIQSNISTNTPNPSDFSPAATDILNAIGQNPQVQQMVSQMLANSMDMNQIASVVSQFNNRSGISLSNVSIPNQNQMHQLPQQQNQQQNQPVQHMQQQQQQQQQPQSNNLGIPQKFMMASQFMSVPTATHQQLLAKDKVSETLSSIPPGVLIELLAKLKLMLHQPNPDYAQAAKILTDNPKLAVAAAQSLLLMGVIDLDVINQAMQTQQQQPQQQNQQQQHQPQQQTQQQPQQQLQPQPQPQQLQPQQQQQQLPQQHIQPQMQMQMQMPMQIPPQMNQPIQDIPQAWIGFHPHTIAKLRNMNDQEASLVVQVLKLNHQQINALPENERQIANAIRQQYL
ncbi:hypothetical protein DAMA08_050710 [Martiniozyma asiatica (nom. inval.)]|nr:hypothetical protein DAMA08_050710 [Martiniozyma asiatica]